MGRLRGGAMEKLAAMLQPPLVMAHSPVSV